MRWTFIITGIVMGLAALALIVCWGKRPKGKGKGETSEFAIVKEVLNADTAAPVAKFALGGRLVSFSVSKQIANHLRVGQQGILTHHDSDFVYFVPREDIQSKGTEGRLPSVS